MKFSHLEKIMNHHKKIQLEDNRNHSIRTNTDVEAVIKKYVQKRSDENYSFESAIINKREFNNPSLLKNCVNVFKINEYGSNFDAMIDLMKVDNIDDDSYINHNSNFNYHIHNNINTRKHPRQEDDNHYH